MSQLLTIPARPFEVSFELRDAETLCTSCSAPPRFIIVPFLISVLI